MDRYALTPELLDHVARLAALELGKDEQPRFLQDLGRVLDYMKELNELNTEGLEATFQTIPISNVMREDLPLPPLSSEQVLQNAPEQERGLFRIPPILE